MKALILAAGLGTRLYPLTKNKPKALVEVNDAPLLEIVINSLKRQGFDEIIINLHHFADQIVEFIEKKKKFDIDIRFSDEKDLLLDTGGGIKKASWFLNGEEPFLVHNVDIITDLDLNDLYQTHIKSEVLTTMAVRNRQTARYLLFDKENYLSGWTNIKTGERKIVRGTGEELTPLAYSGIQVISPRIFDLITEEGSFSVIPLYLRLAKNHRIMSYRHDKTYWIDAGKTDQLKELNNEIPLNLK